MYLEKLSLHNYRGIRDMEIEFDRHLNVFVGDNGCGKTTVIDAVRKCLEGARLNHVAGTERQELEEILMIFPSSIRKPSLDENVRWAQNKLQFCLGDKSILVLSDSDPHACESSLKDSFVRVDSIDYLFLSAARKVVDIPSYLIGRWTLDGTNEDKFVGEEEASAFVWLKNLEDSENSDFRRHVDSGNEPSSFVLNPKLQAAKKIVAKLTDFAGILFNNNEGSFEVVKNGVENKEKLLFEQLSLGERIFLGLVLSIACEVIKSAKGEGSFFMEERLIIIDEIDLHLHPKWQRRIVPALRETFPNCQFIITTHSPQVLSEVPAENIFSLYRDENGDIQYEKPERSRGLSSSDILDEVMDLPQLPPKLEALTDKVYDLIEDEEFEKAKHILTDIENEYGEIPALIEARTYLKISE